MLSSRLVINTLVFAEEIKKMGTLQTNYIEPLAKWGIKTIEVRREMFANPLEEVFQVKKEADKWGMEIFYSVPENVYLKGQLNQKLLEQVAEESRMMGAKRVKFTVGDCNGISEQDARWISNQFTEQGTIVSLENGQLQENGNIAHLMKFMGWCKDKQLNNIDLTFDIGNWLYVGEDPATAAESLKEWVGYIHLKDVKKVVPPLTRVLDEGNVDWRKVIGLFPADLPVAIEYPCGEEPWPVLEKEIKILNAVL